ncbi:MAG: alpha/beta hydrolase [Paracoccaceae bacterium]
MRLSWQARLLTPTLRLIEKPQLARASDPVKLRASFERKARLLFHAAKGTTQRTFDIGGYPAIEATPPNADPDRVILYFHGGGYLFGSPRSHSAMMSALAIRSGTRVILASYPLAPEHPFPAAPNAALKVWKTLIEQGLASSSVVLGGDSAGGGLALSLLQRLISEGMDKPLGTFAFAPLTDMTFSGASVQTNAVSEAVLPASRVNEMNAHYLGQHDPKDPNASPLFGDFEGCSPVWLCADMTEILLDDTRRLDARLKQQNVQTVMTLTNGLPHVWPLFHNVLPEARATLDALAHWIKRLTPQTTDS